MTAPKQPSKNVSAVHKRETIAAISTPPGIGALGIIRISGPLSMKIAGEIFKAAGKKSALKSHTVKYGEIADGDRVIDEVMLTVLKAPNSYTGEDTVEITCHGNPYIMSEIMELIQKMGVRPAEPGEFTKRAFLNGRMDLSQAESVNMLIHAKSENSRKQALKLVKGELKERIMRISDNIQQVKMHIDADIEWGETEKICTISAEEKKDLLNKSVRMIGEILQNSSVSKNFMEGFRVVICGKPNAGKSSIFNRILNFSRSIISSLPGTTRDVIENEIILGDFLIKLVDTAGIGLDDPGEIDMAAAQKSVEEIELSDLIVYVIDNEKGIDKIDYQIRDLIGDREVIFAVNKCDGTESYGDILKHNFLNDQIPLKTSCITGEGIQELKDEITAKMRNLETDKVMFNARQKEALKAAEKAALSALEKISGGVFPEAASYDLNECLSRIGEIDGSILKGDLLDKIFSEFCIGK